MRVNDFYYSLITVALTLNDDWNDMLQIPKKIAWKILGVGRGMARWKSLGPGYGQVYPILSMPLHPFIHTFHLAVLFSIILYTRFQ